MTTCPRVAQRDFSKQIAYLQKQETPYTMLLRIKKEQKSLLKGDENMLFAVIGSSAGKTRDEIMAIYPRHKAFLDQFLTRGEVVGVGPFTDPGGGNMALFRSRAAAEAFARSDPFFLEGAVRKYQIKEWGDTMLS
jgi:uncharacterized protein YciI